MKVFATDLDGTLVHNKKVKETHSNNDIGFKDKFQRPISEKEYKK